MTYDIIIIGAGAAGLFCSINLPTSLNKLILEKNKSAGTKVLLSGGERANISNINIDPERDYFGQNNKALRSVFSQYNQWDIQSFFNENGINIVEEDRGRLILESGDSKELLDLLIKKSKENNTKLKLNSEVIAIEKKDNTYFINTKSGEKFISKNIIISTGGKSFFQVGTTGDGYNFAQHFGLNVIAPHRALCGITTKKDFSPLSGTSVNLDLELKDKDKLIYKEFGPLLFTHFGVSGPIVFNLSVSLGEYLNSIKLNTEQEKIKYILENINIELDIKKENSTKKIYSLFKNEIDLGSKIETGVQDWRSWKEAKATGGGIDLNELDKFMQSKKHKGLFFIGEVVDITGKTGGYNLQWAWSSAYVCSKYF
ncbi:MAG: aminoacetone oxidase family FAD-binding enzyme [Candidatus Gracilibacteria bacterium]|nr:aminoacetone oxidase family FAD-binding enzyme [Candidatus Gracilibacteria bacterium]